MGKEWQLWVVEMWLNGGWQPTVGSELSLDAARKVLAGWKHRNPSDRFRIRRYEPAA